MRRRTAQFMGIVLAAVACLVFSEGQVWTQSSFEAVSIKPNISGSGSSGTSTNQGRLRATNVTVKQLIMTSYRVQDFQVMGGPDWINTDHFDIQAKAEDGAIPDNRNQPDDPNRIGPLELMMQSMLADRFQLSLSHETYDLPVYMLSIAKDGPKIKPVDSDPHEAELPKPPSGGRGAAGSPPQGAVGPGSMSTNVNRTKGEMNANTVPLSRFAQALSRQLRRPVLDQTNLKGMYTIHLEWAPDTLAAGVNPAGADALPPDPSGPSLFTAVQEQLGLKLTSSKGPVQVLVIRSVQKPSEN
jgi:uncharacterized protein (TIGR03435 family)